MSATLYQTDTYAWSRRQVELLRNEDFAAVDWDNLIEEIDSLGREQQNAVRSQLERLLMHLLKWQYQPGRRGSSWRRSITDSRVQIELKLQDNPSLRPRLAEFSSDIYPLAKRHAASETRLALRTFPEMCAWSIEQLLDFEFYPE